MRSPRPALIELRAEQRAALNRRTFSLPQAIIASKAPFTPSIDTMMMSPWPGFQPRRLDGLNSADRHVVVVGVEKDI